MRFVQYLREEYAFMADGATIFVNPSAKEIAELKDNYVRCIADFKHKNLYVFEHTTIHSQVFRKLESEGIITDWSWNDVKNQYCSLCTAKWMGGKRLKFYRSDTGVFYYDGKLDDLLNSKWMQMSDDWLNPWFGPGYKKAYIKGCENPKEWK